MEFTVSVSAETFLYNYKKTIAWNYDRQLITPVYALTLTAHGGHIGQW